MSNKFTEEQYQKIIKAWNSERIYIHQTEAVIDYLIDDLNVDLTLMGDTALAIANPLTREWAHDKFVEKEKKYYWTNKKKDINGDVWYLIRDIAVVMMSDEHKFSIDEQLTESEIREWGYNPEMFDKEEVYNDR